MKKTLVAFFSASGTTKKIAEMIAEAADADLHEIAPKVLYTKDDLNWMNKKSRSSIEMSDKSIRPEIADSNLDMESYDEIILGFPIWIWRLTVRSFSVFQPGCMSHRRSSIHFWKSMISQARRLFCLQLQAEAVLEIQ